MLPTIEPIYSIPTEKNGSNHTPQFALSAKTEDAHHATLVVSKALAATALRVLQDDTFFSKVRRASKYFVPGRIISMHLRSGILSRLRAKFDTILTVRLLLIGHLHEPR